jgi:acyl-coenzyme A synthetase/AMP-(fatty) acid ligase
MLKVICPILTRFLVYYLFFAEKAAAYKKLRGGVKFVEAIPKSPSGKIQRNDIKKMISSKL